MKIIRVFLLALLALLATFLDSAFFSFFEVGHSTPVLSFILVVVFALVCSQKDFLVFTLFSSIFFGAYSSLPVWLVVFGFVVLPGLVAYLRLRFLPEPQIFLALIVFIVTSLIFALTAVLGFGGVAARSMEGVGYFTLINAALGILVFALLKQINKKFAIEEIRI
jgi:hypothetical protein